MKTEIIQENESQNKIERKLKRDTDRDLYIIDDIRIKHENLKNRIEITWKSDNDENGTEFEIWFPRERNPLSIFFLCKWFTIKSRNGIIRKTLKREQERGVYFYSVYTRATKNMAVGNSSPKMIIK